MAFNRTLQHFTSSQELAPLWETGQNYILNQLVLQSNIIYRCVVAHLSGTFSTDLTAGYWTETGQSFGMPIGSIVAFSGGYFTAAANGGTYTAVVGNSVAAVNAYVAPGGFLVCDGTAPNDPASPIFNALGRFLPDLTNNRFLQGSTVAGGIGGQNSTTLAQTNLPGFTITSVSAFNNSTTTAADSGHIHSMFNTAEVRGRIAVGTTSFQIVLNDPAGAGSWNATTRTDFGGNGVSSGTLISTATDTQGNTAGPSGSVTVATASNLPSHNHAVVASAANGFNATAIENRPTFLSVFYIMRIK